MNPNIRVAYVVNNPTEFTHVEASLQPFEVVVKATSEVILRQRIVAAKPHVVLIDLAAVTNLGTVIKLVRQAHLSTIFLIVIHQENANAVVRAFAQGACGYIPATASEAEFAQAIVRASANHAIIDAAIATEIYQYLGTKRIPITSPAELLVLQQLMQGTSVADIIKLLPPETQSDDFVESHIYNIICRLQ